MSDFSLVKEFEEYQIEGKKEKKNDEKFFKWMKIILAILLGILLIEVLLYKVVMPSINPAQIEFVGNKNYSREELMNEIIPFYHDNFFVFDTTNACSKLNSISGIESVDIEKHFPDKITIKIKERECIALTFITQEGRSTPIQIDKNGVLFETKGTRLEEDNSIPIISGLPVEHLSGGMRIPAKYRVLIEQIAKIRALPQKYFAAVSEICVLPKKYGNYELMIIPVNSRSRVLTDRSLNENALQYMMVVLEVVNSIEPNAEEIDLRYGSVSYKSAEQGETFE